MCAITSSIHVQMDKGQETILLWMDKGLCTSISTIAEWRDKGLCVLVLVLQFMEGQGLCMLGQELLFYEETRKGCVLLKVLQLNGGTRDCVLLL